MKKKTILIVILGVCNLALAAVILVSVLTGWRIGEKAPTAQSTEQAVEESTDTHPAYMSTQAESSVPTTEAAPTQIDTEAPKTETEPALPTTEAPEAETTKPRTEPATEPPTETTSPATVPTEPSLPYEDSLGAPEAIDFAWIYDIANGEYHPNLSYLGREDMLGKWKAEFIFDGVWQLAYVTIRTDATISVQPYMIYRGHGWEDQSGESPSVLRGQFDINRVFGSGDGGSIDLYVFYESEGTQYGFGSFETKSGSKAIVGLVRP